MQVAKSFRAKGGEWYITEKSLFFVPKTVMGKISATLFAGSKTRVYIFTVLMFAIYALVIYNEMRHSLDSALPILFFLGFLMIFRLWRGRNYSVVLSIDRKAITKVSVQKAVPGLTRGSVVIDFKEGDKLRKRLIPLPGILSRGSDAMEEVIKALEGLGFEETSRSQEPRF